MSCLLTAKVRGCKRVPDPPARMIPFTCFFFLNSIGGFASKCHAALALYRGNVSVSVCPDRTLLDVFSAARRGSPHPPRILGRTITGTPFGPYLIKEKCWGILVGYRV